MTRDADARAPSPWLTRKEAAARAKCSEHFVGDEIARGRLKAVRLGSRQYRIHVDWVDAWMEASAVVVNANAPGAAIPFKP